MMDKGLAQKLKDAVWIGRSLFGRNKTVGSSADMSFFHDGRMYISRGGSCFGTPKEGEFEVMNINGECLSSSKPSKEWFLHLKIYQKKPGTGAVLHAHGTYGALWSFVPAEDGTDAIPGHTPYLKMKLGKVGLIPYEKPGPQALLDAFGQRVMDSDGYLLKQHRAVVSRKNLMNTFHCLEKLEESVRIVWMLREVGLRQQNIRAGSVNMLGQSWLA